MPKLLDDFDERFINIAQRQYQTAVNDHSVPYKAMHIGNFKSELHAAMAYDIAAKDLFGKFAKLNFKQNYGY